MVRTVPYIVLICLLLTGCGVTGPLYIPKKTEMNFISPQS
ncbi:hypothetical protein EDM53_05755 [Rickettsiales endosymbiont of Peranema trichophorum]|nr:hypothetical protein EDM53_05755 [Rickettsiales endosymbiont of Peranema trichophorum]